jgi:hypothetical protein
MHTTFHHELLRARVTDLHRQAARERMAKAMSSARHPQGKRRTHSVPSHAAVLANRIFTLLGAHGAPPTRLSRASGIAIPGSDMAIAATRLITHGHLCVRAMVLLSAPTWALRPLGGIHEIQHGWAQRPPRAHASGNR